MKKIPLEMYDKVNYMCRCYMDRTARGMFFYDGLPDTDKLRDVLECAFAKVPLLHSKVVDNHIAPYWLECDFSTEEILIVKQKDNLENAADEFLNESVPLNSNIQFMSAVFYNDNKSVFCMKWNHMIMDGGGIKQFLTDLYNVYNDYVKTGVLVDLFSNGARDYGKVYDDMPKDKAKRAKTQFFGTAKKEKKTLPFTEKGTGQDKIYLIKYGMNAEIIEKARVVGKKYGATVNDILSAAYIDAFGKLTGIKDSFTLSCAVDLRRYIKNPEKLGYTNHVSFMSCTVGKIYDNISDTLKDVVKSNELNKKDEFLGLHGLSLLNIGYKSMIYAQAELIIKMFYSNANLSLSNVGRLDTSCYHFGDAKISDAYFFGAAKNKPCAAATAMTVDGKLRITMCINATEKDKQMLEKFFILMGESIKAISEL